MARHFLYASLVFSSCLVANPTGPTLDSGGFVVSGSSTNLVVTTTANTTAITWNQFSSNNGEMLTFQKSPNLPGDYYILNTVTGGSASLLNGTMTTAGSGVGNIYLVNPSGITVGSTGQIIAGSFLASTLQLVGGASSFDPINNPNMTFAGSSITTATNAGSIQSLNGDVTIIGFRVVNSGSISSADTVALGAGINILVQPSSNDRIFIQANGTPGSLGIGVNDTGTITGENIILKADANPYTLAINLDNSGQLSLASCNSGGSVKLVAVSIAGSLCPLGSGAVQISGTILTPGCPITIDGKTISIQTGALLNASSATTGGGTITIGNLISVCPTSNLYIDSTSQIISNATTSGTGGTINILSNNSLLIVGTNSAGNIQSTGNSSFGTGGAIGIFSRGYLGLDANVNVSGSTMGTIQVTAPNIEVGGAANYGTNFTPPSYTIVNVSPIITTAALQYALNNGNLTVFANGSNSLGNVIVNDNFTWTSGAMLSLVALNTVQVNYYGQMTGSFNPANQVLALTGLAINIGPSTGSSQLPTGFQLTSGSIVATATESLAFYGGNLANTSASLSTLSGTETITFGNLFLLEAGAASGANAEIQATGVTVDMISGGLGIMLVSANSCSQAFINSAGVQIGGSVAPTSLTILGGSCSSGNPAYIGSLSGLSNIVINLTGGLSLSGGSTGANNSACIVSSGGLNGSIAVSAQDITLLGGLGGISNQAYIASTGNLGAVSVTTVRDLFITGGTSTSGSAYITSRNSIFNIGRDAIITGGTASLSSAYIEGTQNTTVGGLIVPAIKGLVRRNLMLQGGSNQNAVAEIRATNGDIIIDALTTPNNPNNSWFTFRGGYILGANNAAANLRVVGNGNILVGSVSPPNYVNLVGGAGGIDSYAEILVGGNGNIFIETISDITYLGGVNGANTLGTEANVQIIGNGDITHVAGRDMIMTSGKNGPANVYVRTGNGVIVAEVIRDFTMTGDCAVPNFAIIDSGGQNGGIDIIVGRNLSLIGHATIFLQNGDASMQNIFYGGTLTVTGCSKIVFGKRIIAPVAPTPAPAAIPDYPADAYYRYTFLYELFYRLSYFKSYDWFEFHDSFWNSAMYVGPGNQSHLD